MIVTLTKLGEIVGMYQCSHIGKTKFPSLDSYTRRAVSRETGTVPFSPDQIGIEIECCGLPGGGSIRLRIPRDGDSVYLKSDVNKNVQAFHVDEEGNEINGAEAHTLLERRKAAIDKATQEAIAQTANS